MHRFQCSLLLALHEDGMYFTLVWVMTVASYRKVDFCSRLRSWHIRVGICKSSVLLSCASTSKENLYIALLQSNMKMIIRQILLAWCTSHRACWRYIISPDCVCLPARNGLVNKVIEVICKISWSHWSHSTVICLRKVIKFGISSLVSQHFLNRCVTKCFENF